MNKKWDIFFVSNSQYELLFTLTLAYKLGLEYDIICSDIQCESI